MRAVTTWNVAAFVAALALSTSAAWKPHHDTAATPETHAAETATTWTDHGGTALPRAHYARIASASLLTDHLLLALCEPERIVAFTQYSANEHARGFRFQGKATIAATNDIEAILALHPDLLLVSSLGDPRPVARLREAGLAVYDLGEMHGMSTFVPNIREVAAIVGAPERGERLVESFVASMKAVAADVPPASRKRGMYLAVYGGRFFGGATGTSYHDVISAAGLLDAASSYRDWPDYSSEQVLALDPDVILTNDDMRLRICEHAGLEGLRACASPGGIVELDRDLLVDPGLGMLEAAQRARRAVYGDGAATVTMGAP
ncbi:ABC transporter substrate-binding protein [Pendulispora rubella]|uniref:ABC transporter substrate-binding protein n=1 Tax=Pendulispora rubella TaxID=2741070 RepID=A0ABZ2L2E4_9BACT